MGGQESELASLKVNISFQAGDTELTVKEVQELNPGMLLPIDGGGNDFIEIRANGKRIGVGELVKVGDKMAVRVTRLGSDG